MRSLFKTLTTAGLGLALIGGLGGCTPSQPEPAPVQTPISVLDPSCPVLAPDAIEALRIPQGTPAETIDSVLAAYSAWMSAGSDILTGWLETSSQVPEVCIDGLAEQGSLAYSQTIFVTHTDLAWQQYYDGQKQLTSQSLRNLMASGAAAPENQGRFELLKDISSSATENGTFLKFDAIYHPALGSPVDPDDWTGLATATRWYVELVPFDGYFIINYVEQKATAGY
ncbi:hypothetical protein [Arthrobacter psychrolactophilus]